MLLFVLIYCVDFIVGFRDDFSTIFQSCIVVVVREGVTVRNPKTDSKSEFGRPRYGPKNRGSARETKRPKGPCMVATWAPREPHVDRGPLSTCGPRGPHVGHQQRGQFGHLFPSLLFLLKSLIPSHTFQEAKFEIRIFLTIFSILFPSYLFHTNSKLSDSKTKIVGLEEIYKPQAI